MRVEQLFGQTLREAPADADVASHKLLIRGAFIRRMAAGVYTWLPLGLRVLRKVERIVRQEMDDAGATELLMPALQPAELWQRSGRWQTAMGGELYTLTDPGGRQWCLAPTHEEAATSLAAAELSSYRDLPATVYQIQWKFRYAPRPRGGLLRGREFLMKDAYSFAASEEQLQASYDRMLHAYERIFKRCGLDAVVIEAQAGSIGGTVNHEFTVPSDAGEDTFVQCPDCGYAANQDAAISRVDEAYDFGDPPQAPEMVHTPDKVTVEDVSTFLGIDRRRLAKALVYRSAEGLVCALVPGDRELNEDKLARFLDTDSLVMLTDAEFPASGIVKGFTGPIDLSGVRLVADRSLAGARNLVTGANDVDHHLVGVVPGRDFTPDAWTDLLVVADGDRCERCGGTLHMRRGVEVGHIFQLGTAYSERLGASFSDEAGRHHPLLMGCYGFGISRAVAAVVETHHDERGIIWPRAVAPFEVAILVVTKDPQGTAVADRLYSQLQMNGVETLIDGRAGVSPGAKFGDADLIGCPVQVIVGRSFAESGQLEVKVRASGDRTMVEPQADAIAAVLAGASQGAAPSR